MILGHKINSAEQILQYNINSLPVLPGNGVFIMDVIKLNLSEK